ncbi:hypothetical protein SAY87_010196 [Trapa incisa]|uniref:VTT domain-containing protein n=1 Tax=Trapa incisa TaxID=236973 RepID=A0AAN7GL59_9MYRT|nr:hypothetical protein SAY87_010196 [Trapa incisa]
MNSSDGKVVVRELRLKLGRDAPDEKGIYVELADSEEAEGSTPSPGRTWGGLVLYWVKLTLLLCCLGLLAGVFFKWVWPFLMDKGIMPIINWERKTFSRPILAVIVFITIALFPTILLPSSPSMWVAGMTFGYGYGFLLIFSGVAIGASLPYFIGSQFHQKIQGWLENYPKKASLIRSTGTGNWVHQLRAVAFIRTSPFPYILYNYCAVATDVKYVPYILGSLIGMIPEIFLTIYTGIFIGTLAEASYDRHSPSTPQILFNVLGFLAMVAPTIIFTVYAKRQLKTLRSEQAPLLE